MSKIMHDVYSFRHSTSTGQIDRRTEGRKSLCVHCILKRDKNRIKPDAVLNVHSVEMQIHAQSKGKVVLDDISLQANERRRSLATLGEGFPVTRFPSLPFSFFLLFPQGSQGSDIWNI